MTDPAFSDLLTAACVGSIITLLGVFIGMSIKGDKS